MADELDAIFDQVHGGQSQSGGYDTTDAIFDSAHGNKPPESWSVLGSAKNIATGAGEGILDLGALLTDLNPITGSLVQGKGMALSKTAKDLEKEYLPEESETFRTERNVGRFLGPSAVLGPGGAGARILSGVGGGLGFTLGEEVTKGRDDIWSKAIPIAFSVAGSLGPQVLSDTLKSVWSGVRASTPQELKGSAALVLKEQTGLSADDIAGAIAKQPTDDLGRLMTTAEITQNPGMAQIEKTLAEPGKKAVIYNDLLKRRADAREGIIGNLSAVKQAEKEAGGSLIIDQAENTLSKVKEVEGQFWDAVPRKFPVEVSGVRKAVQGVLNEKQGGLPLNNLVKTLADQVIDVEKGATLTTGALQDIRSGTLLAMRERNLGNYDYKVLNVLQKSIDKAVKQGTPPDVYEPWLAARKFTAETRPIWARGTPGGYLTSETVRPSNALAGALKRGDTQAAIDFKKAVGQDPYAIEVAKRGVLDWIKRTQTGLTADKVEKFIDSNRGLVKELHGENGLKSLQRIASDLKSQEGVGTLAFESGKRGSVTAQKMTVASRLAETINESIVSGIGPLNRIAEYLRQSTGIKNQAQIDDLLFRAAVLEPSFAVELAKTPTNIRVLNAGEKFFNLIKNAAKVSGISGATATATQSLPEAPTEERRLKTEKTQLPQVDKSSIFSKNEPNSVFKKQNISESLLDAVRKQESNNNPEAVSPAGAKGAYQFLDSTGKEYHKKLGIKEPYDPKNEVQQRKLAKAYLEDLLEMFDGDLTKALTAYHSGQGNVKKGNIGPVGRNYAKSVFSKMS